MRLLTALEASSVRLPPALLFLFAMIAGLLLGLLGDVQVPVMPIIMVLLGLLFLEVRWEGGRELLRSRRAAALALALNFLVLPMAALGIVTLIVPDDDVVRLGLLIYLLFPCTDWFLGFTRVAGGSTALGAALIPVSLVLQLLLYPVWVSAVTGRGLPGVMEALWPALLEGLLIPAGAAVALRVVIRLVGGRAGLLRVRRAAGAVIPWTIAALILGLFASGAGDALLELAVLVQVLAAVVLFFAISFALAQRVSRSAGLSEEEGILVVFTTASRNAPLMLAVTSLALGEDPVVTAVIVLGMLLEFPHLTMLSWWLRRRRRGAGRAGSAESLTAAA
ncbi:arsenic resistance protein [Nesterenkonia suensis]